MIKTARSDRTVSSCDLFVYSGAWVILYPWIGTKRNKIQKSIERERARARGRGRGSGRAGGRRERERESHVATLLIISHTFHYSQCSHSLLRLNQLFWFTLPTQQGSRGMWRAQLLSKMHLDTLNSMVEQSWAFLHFLWNSGRLLCRAFETLLCWCASLVYPSSGLRRARGRLKALCFLWGCLMFFQWLDFVFP